MHDEAMLAGAAIRPLEPEADLDALLELLRAVARAEGQEPPNAERLQEAFLWPKNEYWVAAHPAEPRGLIGYAALFHQTTDRCYGDVKVHPAWRRRGVGRRLLDRLSGRAAELDARYLAIDVPADNQDALRFLLSQGLRYRGDVWALVAPAETTFSGAAWPEGYAVRSLADVGDLTLFVDLCHRVFGDLWGHWENTPGMVTVERLRERLAADGADGDFILFDAGSAPVGKCRAIHAAADAPAGTPHILDQPGIVPEARDAGLHAPLALTAARWLRTQSPRPIRLESWGDRRETIALYESLGFALVEHEVSYVLEL
jgi:ribosomal protein S18 acetylase RimI-like enzyme